MKLVSIFFTASETYICHLLKFNEQGRVSPQSLADIIKFISFVPNIKQINIIRCFIP